MQRKEDELEEFRRAWKQEVSAKHHGVTQSRHTSSSKAAKTSQPWSKISRDTNDDVSEPYSYQDLDTREHGHRLDDVIPTQSKKEPVTALDHYEVAVEKENQGSLGDALRHYQKAFKMDSSVQEDFKKKHYPAHQPIARTSISTEAPVKVPVIRQTMEEMLSEFSQLCIAPVPPPTELSPQPPCPISKIPDEILVEILEQVALSEPASLSRLSLVCKRLAFLVAVEDHMWKSLCMNYHWGFYAMHYQFASQINWTPILNYLEPSGPLATSKSYPTYKSMYHSRPRIRFGGCYISTVNYTRPGVAGISNFSWNAPILIVTYYRYLRFFRDGTVISLQTTTEPADVVPYLHKENINQDHPVGSNLPQTVMKEALKGRWRLTGNIFGQNSDQSLGEVEEPEEAKDARDEIEGDIIIETEGVIPKYMYKMQLGFATSGKRAHNNKLVWKGFWSYNRLSDDWGEFALKNDRAFYWSRVRSYPS